MNSEKEPQGQMSPMYLAAQARASTESIFREFMSRENRQHSLTAVCNAELQMTWEMREDVKLSLKLLRGRGSKATAAFLATPEPQPQDTGFGLSTHRQCHPGECV